MKDRERLRAFAAWMPAATLLVGAVLLGVPTPSRSSSDAALPQASLAPAGQLRNVPVGIAASRDGRLFFALSRAIDEKEPISVAEWKNGHLAAYPPGLRQDRGPAGPKRLLSVQALTVDASNRLWILDCARIGLNDPDPAGIKLVAVDLGTNRVVRTIRFPREVAGPTSFLNDVVVDLRRGSSGVAFLTDAAPKGPNGIVVVDLATGSSARRLNDHPSTRPAPDLVLKVEGRPLVVKSGPSAGQPFRVGTDGIALSADGKLLYYSPLTSHHWYRADADVLADLRRPDADAMKTVQDLGDRGFASDGMLGTADGTIFVTDFENNAIHALGTNGKLKTVVSDKRLLWPDSMALAPDGTLYFTCTQIQRGKAMRGKDERLKPFTFWSVKTDSRPLMLGPAGG